MSKITPDEVRRVAALANIGLTDNELQSLTGELAQIVEFVEQLSEVDTDSVDPTNQVTGLVDVWRSDSIEPGLSHDDLQMNAPDWENGQFKVKRVLNND